MLRHAMLFRIKIFRCWILFSISSACILFLIKSWKSSCISTLTAEFNQSSVATSKKQGRMGMEVNVKHRSWRRKKSNGVQIPSRPHRRYRHMYTYFLCISPAAVFSLQCSSVLDRQAMAESSQVSLLPLLSDRSVPESWQCLLLDTKLVRPGQALQPHATDQRNLTSYATAQHVSVGRSRCQFHVIKSDVWWKQKRFFTASSRLLYWGAQCTWTVLLCLSWFSLGSCCGMFPLPENVNSLVFNLPETARIPLVINPPQIAPVTAEKNRCLHHCPSSSIR